MACDDGDLCSLPHTLHPRALHRNADKGGIKVCWHYLQGTCHSDSSHWDKGRADMKGIRKITPSQPSLSPRSRFKAPANVIAAANGISGKPEQQAVKLKLQQAFVEQYSGTEQKVCLSSPMCINMQHNALLLFCVCYSESAAALLLVADMSRGCASS